MKMFSKQKIRKTVWCLLLVALISLIPTRTFRVLADGDILPPFPYDELQQIGENNYVLFKVHGLDQIDYVECILPQFRAIGNYSFLLPGLSYFHSVGWNLQINSIDYCFKNGQKVDYELSGLENATSSLVSIDNEDPNHSFWLEFVYCTSDVYGYNYDSFDDYKGYDIRLFKAQNFIIPTAATPTPTPEAPSPTPELDNKFPTFTNAYYVNASGDNRYINKYLVVNRYYDESNTRYEYQFFVIPERQFRGVNYQWTSYFDPSYNGYDFIDNVFTVYFLNVATAGNWGGKYGNSFFTSSNYKTESDIYDLYGKVSSNAGNNLIVVSDRNYKLTVSELAMNYEATAIYSINTDGTTTRLDGQGGGVIAPTPTPTLAPTPIPQPSITPEPDDPDKNSSWGWGIVNTLKYIFIPDKNKLIRLEKTAQTKFQQFGGGYDDLKRVSGFEDPVRPQNVVMNWQPFGTDSPEQQQQITLVDFEQIDFYLFETPSGMFIKDCLSASFTFLMFGYLIHVIRKHFVIENTSSDESDGGGD